MRRLLSIVSLLVSAAVAATAGCDTSGIHALGRLRDTLVPCSADLLGRHETTSTWLRSTPEGTEIFLLGRKDPTQVVLAGEPACYGHGFIAHDSSTTFEFGSYSLDASGKGFALHDLEYVFKHQPERSILSRDGAIRRDLPAPVSQSLVMVKDGAKLVLTLDGERMRLTSIGDVVEALDPDTRAGAEDVFRLYNLPLLTSQARLLGFGSGAMTQYVDTVAEFAGTIRNRFTVSVESILSPNTLISYHQLEDLSGIVIDGPQKSNVDTQGNGAMDGTLAFLMRGTGGPSDVVIRGKVSYAELKIGNGVASGGTYTLEVEGRDPYVLSYELATDVDLRAVLPVEP